MNAKLQRVKLANLNNLQQRLVTGITGSAILIYGLIYTQYAYLAAFLIIQVFGQREFYKLVRLDSNIPLSTLGTMVGTALYLLSFFIARGDVDARFIIAVFPLSSLIFFVKLYKKEHKPFTNIAFTFLGIIYVALPFSLLNLAVFNGGVYAWQLVIGCLLLLWASDTGAYFAGTYFGKTRLFERVSPKKTWEGTLGGLTLSLVFAWLITTYFFEFPQWAGQEWRWYVLSVIIVVVGTYGDLVESLFKRSIAIKDSGSSIPGHGGFLDRFDGLLLSAPFIATFVLLF